MKDCGGVSDGFEEVEHVVSGDDSVVLDKTGFFVILIDSIGKKIVLEHYSYDRNIKNKFSGSSAKLLCDTVLRKGLVKDLSHAAYLGRELMKAEIALSGDFDYTQDKGIVF